MPWPVAADYEESVQNPHINFSDPELKQGEPEVDPRFQSPIVSSGNFASVYTMNCLDRRVAVRCFLREVTDQQERYAAIADHLTNCELPYTVNFDYVLQGIKVKGNWLPILKMDWVDGLLLHEYIEKNLHEPVKLRLLADKWLEMAVTLKKAGMAHGDLQHGNIFVVDDEFKLIDYDGMFVPRLAGRRSNELGLEHYQHPQRNAQQFGRYLDHFSQWVIYANLVSLSASPALWQETNIADGHLLFRKEDYQDPEQSEIFKRLSEHRDAAVRKLIASFKTVCLYAVEKVPELDPYKQIATPSKSHAALASTSAGVWQAAADGVGTQPSGAPKPRRDRGGLFDNVTPETATAGSGERRDRGNLAESGMLESGGQKVLAAAENNHLANTVAQNTSQTNVPVQTNMPSQSDAPSQPPNTETLNGSEDAALRNRKQLLTTLVTIALASVVVGAVVIISSLNQTKETLNGKDIAQPAGTTDQNAVTDRPSAPQPIEDNVTDHKDSPNGVENSVPFERHEADTSVDKSSSLIPRHTVPSEPSLADALRLAHEVKNGGQDSGSGISPSDARDFAQAVQILNAMKQKGQRVEPSQPAR